MLHASVLPVLLTEELSGRCPKTREKYLSESSHEGEVAIEGEEQKGGIMVLGGGQVIIG